jgi:hypothetical protein
MVRQTFLDLSMKQREKPPLTNRISIRNQFLSSIIRSKVAGDYLLKGGVQGYDSSMRAKVDDY